MRDTQIAVGGDRTLAFTDIGDPAGACVFFFHGAPTSRLRLVPLDVAFRAHGLRVLSPDRPGYGGSTPQPGRSVSDWPTDVAALADALGIDRFVVAGHSSGGAYAVACAALLGERILGAAVLGGVTDMAWPEAWKGFLDGRAEISVMRCADEDEAYRRCVEVFGEDGAGFLAQPFALPAPDAALYADEAYAKAAAAARVEAFRQGVTGYAQDLHLESRGWPFDAGRIRVPVDVVHGEGDTLVPIAHSQHTAAAIPTATLRVLPGHGHFTILSELPEIAAALARRR